MDTPFVTLSHISQKFSHRRGDIAVLRDINISFAEGQIISVVGPSGCGKTTLLRIVSGIIRPTEGTVNIEGSPPSHYLHHKGIGFVFQKPMLFPWRTVKQNTTLPLEIHDSAPISKNGHRAAHLLDVMGLSGFEESYPNQLSGGMLQRAALARALLRKPQLLLLDEPFSALDEMTREQLWQDFAEMWQQERPTVLLVTHSVSEAVLFGDSVLVMSKRPGHIRAEIKVPFTFSSDLSIVDSPEFIRVCKKVKAEMA